ATIGSSRASERPRLERATSRRLRSRGRRGSKSRSGRWSRFALPSSNGFEERLAGRSLVVGVRWSFRGKDAGSVNSRKLLARLRYQGGASVGEQRGPTA